MALKQHIQDSLVEAMKSKNELKTGVLRLLKAAILKFETSGERKEASDSDILDLIQKEVKSRRDSVEQFTAGGRPELADKETAEIAILMDYMPAQLGEDEVLALAKEAIAAVGASGKGDLGKVMGALMPKVKGKADGAMVGRIVNGLLGA